MVSLSAFTPHPEGFIQPYHSKLRTMALFIDASLIFLSLNLSVEIWQFEHVAHYGWVAGMAMILYILFADGFEVYSQWRGVSKQQQALRVTAAWLMTLCVLTVIGFAFNLSDDFSRKVGLTWAVAVPTAIVSTHLIYRAVLTYLRKNGRNTRKYAVVGANNLGQTLHAKIKEMNWLGYQLQGFYDEPLAKPHDKSDAANEVDAESPIELAGDFKVLVAAAQAKTINLIYIALPLNQLDRIQNLLQTLADTTATVFIVPDFNLFDPVRARWNTIQGIPTVSVYDTPFGLLESGFKRLFDILVSLIVLSIIGIPMILIGYLVRKTSPGPALFKQKRYGVNGEEIEVWKFRSMTTMENGEVVTQASKNDPRITPFGAFMRKTSIDEFPQFINVLQGRMSIVGPRPHAVAHNEYYRTKVHGYMLRHKVKPGITGLAQISGCRGETETHEHMQQRVKYDLEYINNWSFWLDVKIFFLTFFKGFVGNRAY